MFNPQPLESMARIAAIFAPTIARIGYELENLKADLETNTLSQGEREAILEALISLEDRLRPLTIRIRNEVRAHNISASNYRASLYLPSKPDHTPTSLSDLAKEFDL